MRLRVERDRERHVVDVHAPRLHVLGQIDVADDEARRRGEGEQAGLHRERRGVAAAWRRRAGLREFGPNPQPARSEYDDRGGGCEQRGASAVRCDLVIGRRRGETELCLLGDDVERCEQFGLSSHRDTSADAPDNDSLRSAESWTRNCASARETLLRTAFSPDPSKSAISA
jgi:hypothetical protein